MIHGATRGHVWRRFVTGDLGIQGIEAAGGYLGLALMTGNIGTLDITDTLGLRAATCGYVWLREILPSMILILPGATWG